MKLMPGFMVALLMALISTQYDVISFMAYKELGDVKRELVACGLLAYSDR